MTELDTLPQFLNVSKHNRDAANQVIQCVEDGAYCALLGPRLSGKTELLRFIQTVVARDLTKICIYIDLQELGASTQAGFFASLVRITAQRVAELTGHRLPIPAMDVTSSVAFRGFLTDSVARLKCDLVLMIDHLEAVPNDLIQALLTSLRAAYMDQQTYECQLVTVVSGALGLATLTVGESSPFRGIARRVFIGDLNESESETLLAAYMTSGSVKVSPSARAWLLRATRSDPHLMALICHRCIQIASELPSRRLTTQTVKRVVGDFICDEAPHYEPLQEAIRLIEDDPELLTCILYLLARNTVPRRELPLPLSPDLDSLYLTGMVRKVEEDSYQLRNEVYRQFLAQYFEPGRVGHLLTMAGRWDSAIDYLEASIRAGNDQYRSDLLAATINSMYASEDLKHAAHYLTRGLSAAFGVKEGHVWHASKGENILKLVGQWGSKADGIQPTNQGILISEDRLEARAYREACSLRGQEGDRCVKRAMPLLIPGRKPVGVVTIYDYLAGDELVEQSERDLQLAGYLNQAARAIQEVDTRQYQREQEKRRRELAETLREISTVIGGSLDLEQVLERILEQMARVLPFDTASIQLLNSSRSALKIIASKGFDDSRSVGTIAFPLEDTYPNVRVWRCKMPLRYPDVRELFPQFADPKYQATEVRAWLGAPLLTGEEAIGVITLDSFTANLYTPEHERLAMVFAGQAAIAIQNARLFDSAQRRIRDLEIVNDIVQIISTKLDTQDLLQAIVSQIADQLSCTHCTLFFPQKEEGGLWLVPQVTHGVLGEQIMTRRFKSGEGLAGWVFQHGESLVLPDAREDPRFSSARLNPDRPRSMLVVPVKVGDRTIGVISADQDEFGWFSESDQRLVDALARQVGIALERATALELLHDIGNRIISAQEVNNILQQIVSGAIKLTNTTSGIIYLISEDGKSVIKSFHHPPDFEHPKPRMNREEGLTRQVIATGGMLVFPDIRQDARVNPVLHDRFRSMIAVPLKLDERKVIGVLYLHDTNLHSFTETEVSLLSTLATQAAIAIVNARLLQNTNEALQKRVAEMKTLQDIDDAITSTLELDAILGMILDRASDLTEATFGHLQLVSEDGQELVLVTTRGATLASIGERLKLGESVTGKAAQENRIYRIPDVQSPEWAHLYRPYIPNMRSELAVPMSFEDRVVGVINIESADVGAFSEDDERLLKGLAKQAAIAIHNAGLYEAIKRQSRHWQALCEASKAIAAGSAAERKQVLNRIVEQAVRCITGIKGPKAIWGAIMLYDEAANELWFESFYPFKVSPELEARLGEGWFLDRDKAPGGRVGITGRTVLEKKPQRVEDVRNDPDYLEFDITIRSELDVPLLDGDRVIGVLSLESDQVGAFDEDDEQALEGLAELAVIAIKNAEQAEQLSRTHAVALMGAWGADIVHDVNREVGAIRRAVFLLQQRSDLSSEVKERLQEIDCYAGNLALPELPEQAPESGRILEFRNASFLDEVIRVEVENLQPAHPLISFKLEQNCLRIQVAMHEQLLRRLLRHLIYNAIGAIPSDKGTQLVTIRTAVQGSIAEVQVEDTGKGVGSEIKPMLFQQPIPHEDDRPGRGLLLVRFLAEQHGGYARLLWSQPGEGTCFAFGIPLAQPAAGSL